MTLECLRETHLHLDLEPRPQRDESGSDLVGLAGRGWLRRGRILAAGGWRGRCAHHVFVIARHVAGM